MGIRSASCKPVLEQKIREGAHGMKQEEMIHVITWALCLCDENNGLPTFYYNQSEEIFQRNFSNQCAFLDEKTCLEKQSALNLEGVQVVKGRMDYPKELLMSSIVEVFAENGLL